MLKAKISLGFLIFMFIWLVYSLESISQIPLSAKLLIYSSMALLIAVQGFIWYRFGKGVRFQEEKVIIPKLFGDLKLESDQILGYQARKSFWGIVLDHSSLTIRLKNGKSHTITVPDPIIDALKSKV